MNKKKIKVFAIFRNNVSYIDPLLERFSEEESVALKVAFSVHKPGNESHLEKVDHVYLNGADDKRFFESGDRKIKQKDVLDHIKAFNPDALLVATSYYSPTTWIALGYARKNHIPIVTRMTVESRRKRNLAVRLIKRIVVRAYCRRVDAGVYECANQKDYMMKYGIPESKLFFAPCSVDNDYYYDLKKSRDRIALRNRIGVSADTVIMVFTGQLIERKRPMDVLEACRLIGESGTDYRMIFMGDGNLRKRMEDYISSHDMNDKVIITGILDPDGMADYLSAADIYLLPSENDASPKALNEAMNFELPIVITDGIETAREMCNSGENGYVIPVGDVKKMADSIEQIIKKNPAEMGLVSREIVSKFNYDEVAIAWLRAITSCLDK